MKSALRLAICGAVLSVAMSASAFADEEMTAPAVATTVIDRYVVNPARFTHRFVWGVLTVAYRFGKAPVDAAFKLAGQTIGTEPNEPLWE